MLKNTKETATNTVEVTVAIAKEKFDAAVMNAYKKDVKKIQVPGFRKGKAPKAIIEKLYGKNVFYETAINDIAPEEANAAIAECGFTPVETPSISDVDFDAEGGVEVKVTFTRKPDVKLGDYKTIEAVKTIVKVEDKDVDAELENARKRLARNIEVTDRTVENGDIADIDYEGFVGGVPFDGGKAQGHKLTIGSGSFIPGFEEQLIGKGIGEEFEIGVKFPEDYHAEELKGKDAQFKVKINCIEKEELPALDDEFAKDVSDFNTLDEYKADIKAKLEKRNDASAERALESDINKALAALVEAEVPSCMVDREVELLVREYDLNMRQQGLSLEMLMQYTGMTLESIKEQYKPVAEVNVRKNLAFEEIIKAEKITAAEEEIEKKYEEIAASYGMKVEEVKKSLPSENLAEEVCSIKAYEVVKAAAKITERTVTAEELEAEEAAKAAADKAPEEAEVKEAPKKRAPRKKKTEEPKNDAE